MAHTNSEILAAVMVAWAKPYVDDIVSGRLGSLQPVIAANAWVKKYCPVASNYSIINDLSFLAVPVSEMAVGGFVRNGMARLGVKDEDIPSFASNLLASMMEKAEKDGCVSLFNTIEIEKGDLERLRSLLERNLPVEAAERYEVKE